MVKIPQMSDELWAQVIALNKFTLSSSDEKNYLSISRLKQYAKCPASYRFSYFDRLRRPPSASMAWGSGFHRSTEFANREIMDKQQTPKTSDVVDATVDKYNQIIKEDGQVNFQLHDTDEGTEKDELVEAAKMYCTDPSGVPARVVKPIHGVEMNLRGVMMVDGSLLTLEQIKAKVEQKDLEGGVPIMGYVDLVEGEEEKVEITDFKTSTRDYKQSQADEDPQLTVYAMLAGIPNVRFDVVRRATKKLSPRWQKEYPLRSLRTGTQFRFYAHYAYRVIEQIKRGNFPELGYLNRHSGDWKCDPRYCQYYYDCVGEAELQWNLRG